MNAKRFFYVAAGILLLVVAYSIGARQVGAQAPDSPFVSITPSPGGIAVFAITAGGDVYTSALTVNTPPGYAEPAGFHYWGNVRGGTVQAQGKSISDVKSAYRGK
jgi:hypothetical protein